MTLTLLFLLLAGFANGLMDMLQFKYAQSVFADLNRLQFWNPTISWKNKYKDYDGGDRRAKFPFAKTVLVFFTDGWHLLKEIMLSSLAMAIILLLPEWNFGMYGWVESVAQFLAVRITFGVGFYMSYEHKIIDKQNIDL